MIARIFVPNRTTVALFAILAAGFSSSVPAQADQAEIDRFHKEYPIASLAIQEQLGHIKGKCRLSEVDKSGKSEVHLASFAADHGFRKVVIEGMASQGSSGSSTVYCLGPETAFVLYKQAGDSAYQVEAIEKDAKISRAFERDFGRFLSAPYAILGTPLAELMGIQGFRVTDAERSIRDGIEIVKVQYESGGGERPDKGWVELLPGRSWAILSGELRTGMTGWKDAIRYRVDYLPTSEEETSIHRVEYKSVVTNLTACEFDKFIHESSPISEFSMSAFGLPDLTKPAPSGTDRSTWLFAIGGAGVVLAALMLALARRISRKVS